jgi:tetratricopeptide (TPR) repeat protein
MRTFRSLALATAALLSGLVSVLGCAAARPTSNRELPNADLTGCYTKAKLYGNPNLKGTAQLYMYVDVDGAVPAAWFHDRQTLDANNLLLCATDYATIAKFDSEKVDYLRGTKIDCTFGDDAVRLGATGVVCAKMPVDQSVKFDPAVAKDTLTFAGWASPADKGWGYYYTQQYPEALAAFRAALVLKADDTKALRGLAQTIAESGGDLKEARAAADKAVGIQKSAATLEAVVRVCLKQGDDECVVKNFVDASKSPDTQARSYDLAALNDAAKAANARLEAAEQKKIEELKKAAEEKLAKENPCYKETGTAWATCTVKRCFGEGAKAYAAEMKKLSGIDYAAGEPITAEGTAGATIVTIPLRAPAPKAAKGKKAVAPENKDAVWTVTDGAITSYKDNASAFYISKDHNACKQ